MTIRDVPGLGKGRYKDAAISAPDDFGKGDEWKKPVRYKTLNFISDETQPIVHPMNGKRYTSKKKFRAETKAHGCIEVGNDPEILRKRKPIELSRQERVDHIKHSIEQLKKKSRRK